MGKRKREEEASNEKKSKKTKLAEPFTKVTRFVCLGREDKAKEQPHEKKIESYEIPTKSKDGRDSTVKICSWNVGGVRACVKKEGVKYLKEENADIICLQETKCSENDLPKEINEFKMKKNFFGFFGAKKNTDGYHMYWCNGEKKGYSGVALWSKNKPIKVTYGMGIEEHDNEGRLITAEYEKFFLVTTYVPNSGNKLVRLDYRRDWNMALKTYLNNLREKQKAVVLCGDLNVSHQEIDLANPKTNRRSAGFTDEEREDFSSLLAEGYIDSFRLLNPEKKDAYTYWTYRANARAGNIGWRLDYFVLSKDLEDSLCDNVIRSSIKGSDHCPIVLTLAV